MRYTEHNKNEPTNKVILGVKVLGLLFSLLFLIAIANVVYNMYQINLTIPLFIIFVIIGVMVYQRMVVEYSYTLDGKTIVVEHIAGRRIKQVFVVNLSKEMTMEAYKRHKNNKPFRTKRLYVGKATDLYQITTVQKNREIAVILKLSPYFVDKAKKTCG
jgi:hypothetical protein